MLSQAQFDPVKFIHDPSTPDVIEGSAARSVFRAVNIRSWPVASTPPEDMGVNPIGEGSPSSLRHDETLHTRQSHLHTPTLRRYMTGDTPASDPDYSHDPDIGYHPGVVRDRSKLWVDEGHHRLVASRLRGDYSTTAWVGDTGRYR